MRKVRKMQMTALGEFNRLYTGKLIFFSSWGCWNRPLGNLDRLISYTGYQIVNFPEEILELFKFSTVWT